MGEHHHYHPALLLLIVGMNEGTAVSGWCHVNAFPFFSVTGHLISTVRINPVPIDRSRRGRRRKRWLRYTAVVLPCIRYRMASNKTIASTFNQVRRDECYFQSPISQACPGRMGATHVSLTYNTTEHDDHLIGRIEL